MIRRSKGLLLAVAHRLGSWGLSLAFASCGVAAALGQVDETGLKPAEWGKVDRKAAVATALRVLDLNAEYSGDASPAEALRKGEGKFTVARRKGELAAIYLKIGEWNFRFSLRDGSLLSAKRPRTDLAPIEKALSADLLKESARRFTVAAGLRADSVEVLLFDSELAGRYPVVQMLIRAYHNGLWATLQPQIGVSATDGSLYNYDVRSDMDFDALCHEKRVPLATCLAAAIDAYTRHRPYRNTVLGEYASVIGGPPNDAGNPHEMTATQVRTLETRVGIPMYRFVFVDGDHNVADADIQGVYVPRQVVSVDMLTGTAMTIWDPGEPLGGKVAKAVPFSKGLNELGTLSVPGQKGDGKAKAVGASSAGEPGGSTVCVQSVKLLISAKLDGKGLLWTFDGKLWHAFKPDAGLTKAVVAASKAKKKPFGSGAQPQG